MQCIVCNLWNVMHCMQWIGNNGWNAMYGSSHPYILLEKKRLEPTHHQQTYSFKALLGNLGSGFLITVTFTFKAVPSNLGS